MFHGGKLLFGLLVLALTTTVSWSFTTEGSKKIHCYECKSWEDDRCNDPYNKEDLTPNECTGSCYKIVIEDAPEGIQTGVERGCITRRVEDSECVTYSDGNSRVGTQCLCPEDRCNGAGRTSGLFVFSVFLALTIFVVLK